MLMLSLRGFDSSLRIRGAPGPDVSILNGAQNIVVAAFDASPQCGEFNHVGYLVKFVG